MRQYFLAFSAVVIVLAFVGCVAPEPKELRTRANPETDPRDYVAEYLHANPSLSARTGDGAIVWAPPEDSAVAHLYPRWPNKGPMNGSIRLTIMTAKSVYRIGEEVRVIHVLEAPEKGCAILAMGPKPIQEEYVDGVLRSAPRSEPMVYSGRVRQSPGVDFLYEVSVYKFDSAGEHTIQWKGGGGVHLGAESNVLRIIVTQ